MPKRLAIIDYGLGNLHSVAKALQLAAPDWRVSLCTDERELQRSDKLVFPGVGAIGDCLDGLARLNLTGALIDACRTTPCLAICVGFQALFSRVFEFGERAGLGLLTGEVRSLHYLAGEQGVDLAARRLRVPHSGWNQLRIAPAFADHPLLSGTPPDPFVYFVHSYALVAEGQNFVAATANHGLDLAALVIRDNLIGCQFHPEKSHAPGQRLLRNFIEL